jgi:outer membrane protein assembly factor BamB
LQQLTKQWKADKIVRTFQVRCLWRETYSRLELGGDMLTPREHSQPIAISVFLSVACLLLCGIASAAPSITLSKKSGPPTSKILVSGRGFEPNVGVDIFFDTKDKALVVTNGNGEFDNAAIYAPHRARPGEHWVTALERNNDKGAQEPFLVRTNWSEFHFDADGTRLNPYENVLNVNNAGSLDLKWSYATGLWVVSSPAVVDGVVYIGSGDYNVYALNADTGAKLWSYHTGYFVSSSPAVANGVVYVGSDDFNVYALNAHTGAKLWSYNTGGIVDAAPVVANGVVYVGGNNGLYALNAHTGALLWSNPNISTSPVLANGVVYVGSYGGNVYALNAVTGAKLWSYPVLGGVLSPPAVADGVVYFGADDISVNMYALNASTGAKLWSENLCGSDVEGSPAVANRVVYVTCTNGDVYALNPRTGASLWSYHTHPEVDSSPAVANGVIYFGSWDYSFYALNARTGSLLWSYPTGNWVNSSPAVANGVVYVGSIDFNVYAFSLNRRQEHVVATSERPDLRMLRPDFSLKASNVGATLSSTER